MKCKIRPFWNIRIHWNRFRNLNKAFLYIIIDNLKLGILCSHVTMVIDPLCRITYLLTYLLSPLRAVMHIRPSPETSMPACLGINAELVAMSSLFPLSPSPSCVSRSPSSSFQLVSISMQPWGWRLGAFYTCPSSFFLSPEIVEWCWSSCTALHLIWYLARRYGGIESGNIRIADAIN